MKTRRVYWQTTTRRAMDSGKIDQGHDKMSVRDSQGFVAIWNGMAPGADADFIAWHETEHMPERLAIPGFRRGSRWGNPSASPRYFTLYELDDAQVAKSAPYLDRLNAPTPWTRKVMASFRDNARCVGAFTIRLGIMPEKAAIALPLADAANSVTEDLAQQIMAIDDVLGCHIGLSDTATSSIATAERQGRAVGEPQGLILIALTDQPSEETISALARILPQPRTDLTPRSLELRVHAAQQTV